jgi:putative transposase
MKALAMDYPIADLCRAFSLSRSGYYAWLKRKPSARSQANQRLGLQLQELFCASRKTYGSPRLTFQLRAQGAKVGRHRVARLMRQQNIRALQKRRFRPQTTNSRHSFPIAKNLLAQGTIPSGLNQVWVTDITYIHTQEGWLYLAAIMDLKSRKIVGWSAQNTLKSSLVSRALKQAIAHRRPRPGLLHHSDRGIQYASCSYQALLHSKQIVPSMSRKANCYDNATIESFWSTLKTEIPGPFSSREQASQAIFNYIETFYNRRRLHSALDYKSPVDYESQFN